MNFIVKTSPNLHDLFLSNRYSAGKHGAIGIMTNHPVSFHKLKAMIEGYELFSASIEDGEIEGWCKEFSDEYSYFFVDHGIDHIELYTRSHTFLAIQTSDRGVVIFDPTFRQLYPHFHEHYFLDSPENLHAYMIANKGLDAILQHPFTARDMLMQAKIEAAPFCTANEGTQALKSYFEKWKQALSVLSPAIDPLRLSMNAQKLQRHHNGTVIQ